MKPTSRLRWHLLTGGLVASALALLASARPARLDRAAVGSVAAIVVAGAAVSLVGAAFGRATFRVVAITDLVLLLFGVLWGGWWFLPLAAFLVAALLSPEPLHDRRSGLITASGAAFAGLAMAAAALAVPPDQPPLWACYRPDGAPPDTNVVFDALSRSTGRGRTFRPGVDGVSVRARGVRVDIDPYVGDDELEAIRRLTAQAPGVSEVRRGEPCPA